jgi:hypothetical protein
MEFVRQSGLLTAYFAIDVDVALFFRKRVSRLFTLDQSSWQLHYSMGPSTHVSSGHVQRRSKNVIDLTTSESIICYYNLDIHLPNAMRNCITINCERRSWKLYSADEGTVHVWERCFRHARILKNKCKSFKVVGGEKHEFDFDLWEAQHSLVDRKRGRARSASENSSSHIVRIELPDNSGIVSIKCNLGMTLKEVKSLLFSKLGELVADNAYSSDPSYTQTNTLNPLLGSNKDTNLPQSSFEHIIKCGKGAYLFKTEPRSSLSSSDAVLSDLSPWSFDENIVLQSLHRGSDESSKLLLSHTNTLPHDGINCAVNEVETLDVFKKPCLKHEIRVWHGPLTWRIEYASHHFNLLEKRLRKAYSTRPEISNQKISATPLPVLGDSYKNKYHVYISSLLRHPWASGSIELLEFIGALSSVQDNVEGRNVIHISRLSHYVSPGDIILFQSSDIKGGFTRMAIKSEWDHLGVVVRDSNIGGLKILESTGEGVNAYPLVGRLRGYYLAGFVSKIGIRRVSHELFRRSEPILKLGIDFVNRVKGKPYSFALSSYFSGLSKDLAVKKNKEVVGDRNKSLIPPVTADTFGNKKGYFCSELVFAYLQHIGAINRSQRSDQILPNHFEEGGLVEQYLNGAAQLENTVHLNCRILELAHASSTVTDE